MKVSEMARTAARKILPYWLYLKVASCYGDQASIRVLGRREYRRLQEVADGPAGGPAVEFEVPGIPYRVRVRPGTTDAKVLQGCLLRKSFACVGLDPATKLIIDGGANVGYASVYFLNTCKEAQVWAVEPDEANFSELSKNLEPYGERVHLVKAGLWPFKTGLRVHRADRADGNFVSPAAEGEPHDCLGVDPLTLLQESGFDSIDLFKCDIEGAEKQLFEQSPDAWLKKTRAIAMEIHNQEAAKSVYGAVRRHGLRESRYRELHLFTR